MTRRRFLHLLCAAGAAVMTASWRRLSKIAAGYRTGEFPGRVRSFRESEIRRPARWLG
ncbi:twin-arginine translocation signal domain-containing protein [bacterium]|nr:twin-arginine translocation signal domain-containing protein [bacterium]